MDAVFNGLNDRQREAVTATEGYVRVIAGAGSGKTKLLVSRYAYLVLALGIDPANILCVTFTNKAAGEMKARIRAAIGEGYDTGLTCTYHGFCARLLREDGGRLFLDRGFRILDTGRMKGMLEEIYRKRELRLDHASFEDILRKLGRIKADTAYVPAMTDPTPRRILADVAAAGVSEADLSILEELLQRQKAVIGLDFHDLINYALYLLETNAEVRSKWQERLNYIQVDEFQDSSRRELHLVELLSGGYGNLMIVGDPDQNIYEWRGSDVRLLVDFDKAHTPCQTVFLDRNYRSTPQILTCANTLIDCNTVRLKKDLYTCAPPGEPVMHYHEKSDGDEAARVLALVRELHAGGYAYADMAVLYRSGFLSRTVEKKLTEGHIPYEIVGGVRFFRRMEVLDMMAYLRLMPPVTMTPSAALSMCRAANWDAGGWSCWNGWQQRDPGTAQSMRRILPMTTVPAGCWALCTPVWRIRTWVMRSAGQVRRNLPALSVRCDTMRPPCACRISCGVFAPRRAMRHTSARWVTRNGWRIWLNFSAWRRNSKKASGRICPCRLS